MTNSSILRTAVAVVSFSIIYALEAATVTKIGVARRVKGSSFVQTNAIKTLPVSSNTRGRRGQEQEVVSDPKKASQPEQSKQPKEKKDDKAKKQMEASKFGQLTASNNCQVGKC
jgi:hypothetical protein